MSRNAPTPDNRLAVPGFWRSAPALDLHSFSLGHLVPQLVETGRRHGLRLAVGDVTESRHQRLRMAFIVGKKNTLSHGDVPAQNCRCPPAALRFFERLFEVEFSVIAPHGHPLTCARKVDWQQLAREP